MTRLIKTDAPQYRAKAPATGDAELGRRLVGEQTETNMCFHGDTVVSEFQGWSTRTLTYDGAADGDLQSDFGEVLKVEGEGETSTSITLVLKDVSLTRLDDLFFNGAGPCAVAVDEDDYANGRTEQVITRALKAGEIEIRKSAEAGVGVTVDTEKVGGEISSETGTTEEWAGLNLYFAHHPESVRVTRFDRVGETLNVGTTLDLQMCGFTLDAVQEEGWEGRLSCPEGPTRQLNEQLGSFDAVRMGPGVSYSVRVRGGPGVAQGIVDMHRFNVVASRD